MEANVGGADLLYASPNLLEHALQEYEDRDGRVAVLAVKHAGEERDENHCELDGHVLQDCRDRHRTV